MDLLPLPLAAELAAIGLCTGFLAGLLGLGGGMILVPFMSFVLSARGYPEAHLVKTAIATALASICFTSLSSVRAHQRRSAVLWPVVWALAPGILIGSFAGSQFAAQLPGRLLAVLFSVFIAASATQMLLNRKPRASRGLPAAPGMFAAGGVIGWISAMVGGGGAFLSVPFMSWCNVRIHQAVGTASALGFPIALAGTAGYLVAGWQLPDLPRGSLGYLYLPALLVVSLASVATAPLGAHVAHRMDTGPLRRVFALVLYALAGYFVLR